MVDEYSTIGPLLRLAREKKNKTVDEVAATLRIRASYISALEEGRFKDLPGQTYASGFVRTYADYLGLNVKEISDRFLEESAGVNRSMDLAMPETEPEKNAPKPWTIILGLVLILVFYTLWSSISDSDKPQSPTPEPSEVKTVQTPKVSDPSPLAPAPDQVIDIKKAVPVPPPPQELPKEPKIAEISQPSTPPPPPATEQKPDSRPTPPPAAPAPVAAQIEQDIPQPPTFDVRTPEDLDKIREVKVYGQYTYRPRIIIVAKKRVWLQVMRYDTLVLSRTLNANDYYQVSNNFEGLVLKTKNAAGLDIYIDGELLNPIGSENEEKNDFPLNPVELEVFKHGYQPPVETL